MNGNGGQPQQRPTLPPVAALTCKECQTNIQVRIPHPIIINSPAFTQIMFPHETQDKCPQCGSVYLFTVQHISEQGLLELAWMKLQTESQITPGTSQSLRQVLETNDLAKKVKPQ